MADNPQTDEQMMWAIEEFGREAIRLYHAEGLELGLFQPEHHDMVMESLKQKAELNIIKAVQKHFDDHAKDGTECEDYEALSQRFELTKDDTGKITVGARKTPKELMN